MYLIKFLFVFCFSKEFAPLSFQPFIIYAFFPLYIVLYHSLLTTTTRIAIQYIYITYFFHYYLKKLIISEYILLSYKRRGRRGPLPQHWSVLKQYGLGWKFKAGNVVKEEWENSGSVNCISMHVALVFDIRRCKSVNW